MLRITIALSAFEVLEIVYSFSSVFLKLVGWGYRQWKYFRKVSGKLAVVLQFLRELAKL